MRCVIYQFTFSAKVQWYKQIASACTHIFERFMELVILFRVVLSFKPCSYFERYVHHKAS